MWLLFLFAVSIMSADLDNEAVANLITVITSTNPISSHPNTKYLHTVQRSLFRVPALRLCKKIIVFDGVKESNQEESYSAYKERVIELTKSDPYFANTELVFCPEWRHLTGALKLAMERVTTPFVLIHQHDLVLKKSFDLNGLLEKMMGDPSIQYVHFCVGPNSENAMAEEVEGRGVPLCRFFAWTDRTHVARKSYYENFVFPNCPGYTFMESVLCQMLLDEVAEKGPAAHSRYGTYLYGGLSDGCYILHLDARHN